jgi:symplekin
VASQFELPAPVKLSSESLKQAFQSSVDRILQSVPTVDRNVSHRAGLSSKSVSLDSVVITDWNKEGWVTLLSRLSARALNSPEPIDSSSTLPNILRERLFEYVMTNFREHMDFIILWLTEEWYNDTLTRDTGAYNKWATRIFDNILPFVEASKDSKLFVRFLGDIPLITASHVHKLGSLCLDPERQQLGFTSVKYLLLLRPPAREACIELCVDLYRNRKLHIRPLVIFRCRHEERCWRYIEEMETRNLRVMPEIPF